MIATQIFTVVLISLVYLITCPATATGDATKPNMKQFAVVNNKPEDPTTVEEELNQSESVKTSVPTKIRHVVTKSIGLFFWPLRKSWNVMKNVIIPLRKNMFEKQTPTKIEKD
ncbi:uncharacterized protein LOC100570074 precursor [Acyrthosiphon pisum]|uniref:ACYPI44554 protein n=1 Tax=Acyrthosiphon pisum TaxID=7029 RepID=C4WY41_ACYPI|nr:uncharacterized protein LOC100570074 precursor [Acyrthosiphon pisum]BAH72811.1 ACYPI44554 [Acyrthosiphon pisum]|eukprot:NP_001233088.1 uncharacterized protein LOC100570074 precursor [Acyrthosiphon pisum]